MSEKQWLYTLMVVCILVAPRVPVGLWALFPFVLLIPRLCWIMSEEWQSRRVHAQMRRELASLMSEGGRR